MASEAFNKLKDLLKEKGTFTAEDVDTITKAHGALSDVELITLEAHRLKLGKSGRAEISMDDYLKATKVLDSSPEGSEEYKAAEEIVNAFEAGG